jgi:beta propeller repeat protein
MRRAALMAVLIAAACSAERRTTGPDDTVPGGPLAASLIVSDPEAASGPAASGPAGVPEGTMLVYVSIPPGVLPDSARVRIVNLRTADAVAPAVVAGGFDPVAVPAVVGDTLDVSVSEGSAAATHTRVVALKVRPPRVVRTSPPKGQTDVPLNAVIVIVISEPVDPGTVNSTSVRLHLGAQAVTGALELGSTGTVLRFTPDVPLQPASNYHLDIAPTLSDRSGTPIEAVATVGFTTVDLGAFERVTVAGPASLIAGGRALFSAAPIMAGGTAPSARPVVWRTDDAAVATVDQTGMVIGVAGGTVSVTATIEGVSGTARLRVVPSLDFCKTDPASDTGCRLTDGPSDKTMPSVSGNRVVWADRRASTGHQVIVLMDLASGKTRDLTPDNEESLLGAIDGDRIVFARLPAGGDWQLMTYDLRTGTTSQFSTISRDLGLGRFSLSGNRVVWHTRRNNNWDVYLFDFSTNTETRLTTDPADQADPSIFGNRVVWSDRRQNAVWWDLYLYDLTTKTETRITQGTTLGRGAAVSADWIVWGDIRGAGFGLYAYDFKHPGVEQPLVARPVEQGIVLAGSTAAWLSPMGRNLSEGYNLFAYDIATSTQVQVTHRMAQHWDEWPGISPDYLVWVDHRNGHGDIYVARLGDLFKE